MSKASEYAKAGLHEFDSRLELLQLSAGSILNRVAYVDADGRLVVSSGTYDVGLALALARWILDKFGEANLAAPPVDYGIVLRWRGGVDDL